ncbi:MAG: hypothetical protein C4294_03265 [Nitrospiraceae bacterium]
MRRKEVTTMQWKLLSGLVGSTLLSFMMLVIGVGFARSERDAAQAPTETITLKIEGWTCASCEKDIRRALLAVHGVKRAEVRGAIVEVDPESVKPEQLVLAVAKAGNVLSSYHATVVPNGALPPQSSENWWQNLFGLFQ